MRTKIEYPWYLRTWFIVLLAASFWLVVPIPVMVFLLIRRLEYRQLCRLIIAKLISIDFYMEEIAELEGRKQVERFKRSFEIKEAEYQELNKLQEELHREYDFLVFRKILNEKIMEDPFSQPSVRAIPEEMDETLMDTLHVDIENEKRTIKEKVEKRRREEDLEEIKKIKERKRAKKVRKLKEERKIDIDSGNRAGEVPFFREESHETVPFESAPVDAVAKETDREPAFPVFPSEPGAAQAEPVFIPDELSVSVVSVPEAPIAEEATEPVAPQTPLRAKEEPKAKEPKTERVRPVMQGNRVYLSFDDFDDDF